MIRVCAIYTYTLPDTGSLSRASGTQQTLANALPNVTLGKEVSVNCTSATASLLSTFCQALGKKVTITTPSDSDGALPSVLLNTRQKILLCRVSAILALDKEGSSGQNWSVSSGFFRSPRARKLQSEKIAALGKEPDSGSDTS